MSKILIAGCGDVGTRLARRLHAAGHEVYGLARRGVDLPGVYSLQADVCQPDSLRLPAALDAVVVALAPDESTASAYQSVYVQGTRNLLQALQGQTLRHLFWLSSSSVYAQDDGGWVDESSATLPTHANAQCLLQAERLLATAPWPCTVLRLAGLYGPGRERLLRWVEQARPVQVTPVHWSNRLHVEDAAALLEFLWQQRAAGRELERLYIGCDNSPAPQHEVLDWLAAALHRAPPPRLPAAAEMTGQNKRLSNARIRALGFSPRYASYREGYAEILRLHQVRS